MRFTLFSSPQRLGSFIQGFLHFDFIWQSAQQYRSPHLSQWKREHIRGLLFVGIVSLSPFSLGRRDRLYSRSSSMISSGISPVSS